MSRRSKNKPCVYCGERHGTAPDHVPPRGIFPTPPPANLITVPACKECNGSASKDDEYFRTVLGLRQDVGDHPEAGKLTPGVLRGLARPEAGGLRRAVLKDIRSVDVYSAGGLYLWKGAAYNVDLHRLDRVVGRITKGLFYHRFGRRLPSTYDVTAYSESGLRDIDSSCRETLGNWCSTLKGTVPITLGERIFSAWVKPTEDDSNATVWLFEFYGTVRFLSMTSPADHIEAARKQVG